MIEARDVANLLGGKATLGRVVRDFGDLAAAIEQGLPSRAMRALIAAGATSAKEISESVRIPERTLMRLQRRDRFPVDESDKIYRLAYIVAFATKAIGSAEKAHEWLRRPNRALGNRVPLRTVHTEPGLRQVEQELGRIEYGALS